MTEYRELAKANDFEFGVEDHGCPFLFGNFSMDGSGIGLGYVVDTDFILGFMGVFGVERLRQVNGKTCWLIWDCPPELGRNSSHIIRIEPLWNGEGRPFDIVAWKKKLNKDK